jgi:glycosyltransferase involved in cell wall biosynthesis
MATTVGVENLETAAQVRKSLRVVMLSSTDYMGGASRSAYRLHDGLRKLGCESRMFVGAKVRSDPEVQVYRPSTAMPVRLARTLRHLRLQRDLSRYAQTTPFESTLYFDDRTRWGGDPIRQIPDGDVIHLHWVGGFLDYGAFFRWLPKTKPLVVTLHDIANFTGGCCFDLGCDRFTRECGSCPQFGSQDEQDLTRQVWRRKRDFYKALDAERVRLVAPCKWMADQARRSSLFSRFECSVVPNGVDTEVFQPRERRTAREVLGIPVDATVLLFLADNVNMYRKGFHVLARALEDLEAEREVFLLSLGKNLPPQLSRTRHVHFDDITNDRTLSFVYSAADVFMMPSLADNFPNTVLESIACGTPVVAFETGGVPEAVRPGVTGFLAPTGDAVKLKDGALRLLDDPEMRRRLGANCRKMALAEYDVKMQARRYLEIYEALRLPVASVSRGQVRR